MKPGDKIRIVQTDGDIVVWDKIFVIQEPDQFPPVILPPIMDIEDISKN
jgi:hypothetical protein